MAIERTFAQILEEKLGHTRREPEEKSQKAPHSDTLWGQFDFAIPPRQQHHFTPINIPYPKVRRKPCEQAASQPQAVVSEPAKPFSISFWQLDMRGQKAFRVLIGLGALLKKESISLEELKKEYRRLAKIYHPDHQLGQSGFAEKFILLKKAESILSQVVEAQRSKTSV